ncbi:MAG: DNA-directed RNA polymerase subunit omega [Lachnospiraceae bacterium]|jgi:DNA-directed RNA polymerase subunit omega|nr:DNA-directed RNA polymerase subunit omega [Lachnospiraceae bacterium]
MLHPSYTDLMKVVNSGVEEGETPVVNSRYSIVLATSKRARQIIAGEHPLVQGDGKKPLSVAIQELESGKVKIVTEEELMEEEAGPEAVDEIPEDAAPQEESETVEDSE